MAKFQFSGGGGGAKTENTQSAKKWLNFNFLGEGCQNWKYSKCQEMAKFQFSGGGGTLRILNQISNHSS